MDDVKVYEVCPWPSNGYLTMFKPKDPTIDVGYWSVDGLLLIVEQRSVLNVVSAATHGRLEALILWSTIRHITIETQDRCHDGIVSGIDYGVISMAQEADPSY